MSSSQNTTQKISSYQNPKYDEGQSLISSEHGSDAHQGKRTVSHHISFSANSDDENESGDREHPRSRFLCRKNTRTEIILVVFLTGIAIMFGSSVLRNKVPPSSEGTTTERPLNDPHCAETSPIMTLKHTSTVENVQHGAVAADMEICSRIGMKILRDHAGNAVDAAVATTFCLGVVNPASSGIGGGAMILIHSDMASHQTKVGHEAYEPPLFHDERDVDKRHNDSEHAKVTEFIDCREVAPDAADWEMFKSKSSETGGLAVAVPGELRGLELAHSRHGILKWRDVIEPSMKLARDGFEVTPYLAHEIEINAEKIARHPHLQDMLMNKNTGALLQEGEILKQPMLARTLLAVMANGADALYKGELADKLAQDIRKAGGIITTDDLGKYRASLRTPLIARDVGGFTLVGAPPPSSGGSAIIGAARFMSMYHNPYASYADTLSSHRFVEASKHVFGIRMSLSDPAYYPEVTAEAIDDMVRNGFINELRQKTLDNGTLPIWAYGGDKWGILEEKDVDQGEAKDANEGDRRKLTEREHGRRFGYLNDHGTTHLSVIDKDRNAVSITSTVNTYFGSKVVSPSTGIVLNNQMDDFSTPGKPNHFGLHPSRANYVAPGKKPLSSMAPTMVFQPRQGDAGDNNLGDIVLVLGASGGPKIISAVTQVFFNYALRGMPLYESVVHPRLHNQLLYHSKDVTTWERAPLLSGPVIEVSARTRDALKRRGDKLLPVTYMGTVQAVAVDLETGTITAVSDVRKVGKPAGY